MDYTPHAFPSLIRLLPNPLPFISVWNLMKYKVQPR